MEWGLLCGNIVEVVTGLIGLVVLGLCLERGTVGEDDPEGKIAASGIGLVVVEMAHLIHGYGVLSITGRGHELHLPLL